MLKSLIAVCSGRRWHGDADLAGVIIIIICVYYDMRVAHQYSTLKNETLKYTRNIKYTQLNNQWEAKFA